MKININKRLIETEEIQYTKSYINALENVIKIYFKGGRETVLEFDNEKDLNEALNKLQNPKQLLQG